MPDPVLASTRFKVTAADLTAANRSYLRWTTRTRQTWGYLVGITLVATCGIALVTPNGWSPPILAATAAGALASMFACFGLMYAAVPLFARRAIRTQPNLRHEWRVDLSERGMRAMTPNQDNFVAWPDYVALAEDTYVLLLYQGDRLFQLVPKRGLEPGFIEVVRRFMAGKPKR